ncbi:hypothetical protein GCM10028833_25400 [Glycomyces tarimensis]
MIPANGPPEPPEPVTEPADPTTSAGSAGRIPADTPAPSTAAAPRGATSTGEV